MKKPEVGDTVVIHGTVTRVTDKCVFYDSKIGHHRLIENMEDLEDVIPKPWVPEVGGRVKLLGGNFTHEILAIDGNSAFIKCVAVNYQSASHSIGDHRCTPLESLVCAD